MRCRGLHNPHIWGTFFAVACPALHRIALPVVSEWYQQHPRIRVTPSLASSTSRSQSENSLSSPIGASRAPGKASRPSALRREMEAEPIRASK